MKNLFKTLALTLALVLALAAPVLTGADFGDYSGDSDFGGSSSWGGDSWGSSSSWSSGSSWSSSSRYDDDDYETHTYSSSFDLGDAVAGAALFNSFESSPVSTIVLVVIVVILVIAYNSGNKNNKNKPRGGSGSGAAQPMGAERTNQNNLQPIEKYGSLDPNFSASALEEKLSNRYVQMQNAWTDQDIAPVRPFFTDAFYNQMDRQLQQAKAAGRVNHVERINVQQVILRGYRQENGMDHIIAELRTRIVDYTVDRSGNVISGSRSAEKFMVYEWDLVRKSGLVTGKTDGATVVNCPNCGAPLNINATAHCPYCDSVVVVEAQDWAINAIRGISQQTRR